MNEPKRGGVWELARHMPFAGRLVVVASRAPSGGFLVLLVADHEPAPTAGDITIQPEELRWFDDHAPVSERLVLVGALPVPVRRSALHRRVGVIARARGEQLHAAAVRSVAPAMVRALVAPSHELVEVDPTAELLADLADARQLHEAYSAELVESARVVETEVSPQSIATESRRRTLSQLLREFVAHLVAGPFPGVAVAMRSQVDPSKPRGGLTVQRRFPIADGKGFASISGAREASTATLKVNFDLLALDPGPVTVVLLADDDQVLAFHEFADPRGIRTTKVAVPAREATAQGTSIVVIRTES